MAFDDSQKSLPRVDAPSSVMLAATNVSSSCHIFSLPHSSGGDIP